MKTKDNGGNGKRKLTRMSRKTKAGVLSMPVKGTIMPTVCCSAPVLVCCLQNGETQLVCAKCKAYIGHMAPRAYALLYQLLPASLREELQECGYYGEITMEAMQEIEQKYARGVIIKAKELLAQIVKEHLDGGEEVGGSGQADDCETGSGVHADGEEDDPEVH